MTKKHFIAFAQYSFDAELDALQISKLMSVLSTYNSGFQARKFLDYIENEYRKALDKDDRLPEDIYRVIEEWVTGITKRFGAMEKLKSAQK